METPPGEVIKEELWRNIAGNELSDYPNNVADKIMVALNKAGFVVVKMPPSAACRNCGHSKYAHDDPEVGRCYHGDYDPFAPPCGCTAYQSVSPT
jgi:hypothetical protein